MFLNSGFSCLSLSSPKCRSTPRKHPACLRCAGTGISILSMSIILLQNTCTRILVQSTALRIEKGYLVHSAEYSFCRVKSTAQKPLLAFNFQLDC